MKSWKSFLVATIVLGSATPGCKVTTCDPDDDDCGVRFDDGGEGGDGASAGRTSSGGSTTNGGGGATSSGGSSGSTSGGASGGGSGSTMEPMAVADTCDPDDPSLGACNACIQAVCCTEILACSNDVACSGDYEDADGGMATQDSEIRCVREQNDYLADESNADPNDPDDPVLGFAGQDSVDLALERCAEDTDDGELAQTTTQLVECMLHGVAATADAGDEPEFGDCAAACFGVEF